jgi:hypothetical protein
MSSLPVFVELSVNFSAKSMGVSYGGCDFMLSKIGVRDSLQSSLF